MFLVHVPVEYGGGDLTVLVALPCLKLGLCELIVICEEVVELEVL